VQVHKQSKIVIDQVTQDQPTSQEIHEAEQVIRAVAPMIKQEVQSCVDEAIGNLTPRQRQHNE
jgi:hypothetical protein